MNTYHMGTKCVQGGYTPGNGEPRQVPIIQSTTFKYNTSEDMGKLFDLEASGYFYTRLQNPTNDHVAAKIAAMEGGTAAMLTSSGQAANFFAMFNICEAGDHIVASSSIYGGTFNLISVTMKKMGIDATFVSPDATEEELNAAFQPNTKLMFGETIANPALTVLDIELFAKVAHAHGVPLIVDNTFPTPVNCHPIEWGADIVTHSTTKYMDGHGAAVGGAIVDSGKFDWMAHADKYPGLCTPDESYHGITYAEKFGKEGAFITKCTSQLMRDLGSIQAPQNAFILNLGLESLHVRMPRHVENGQAVWPREVGLSPYGAGNGWLLRLESREDAPGAGMETRLYVLSCTWQEGIRTHELEYAFRLNLPSVPPGPLTEPVVVAGDTRVDLDGDASATAAMGSFLHITSPDNVVSYALAGQGADGGSTGQGGESLSSGGGGSIGVRLEYLGGRAPGASSDQTQHYTLTYTWADGTTESRAFTLYAYTPRPEWDDESLRIRYPGDTEWTELDTLIPVPQEWANQDVGGRNEATDLVGLLTGTGGMVDGLNGWFVFSIGQGVAHADTYVYRTRDGGRTWQETGRPDPARMMWYPSYTYFIDSYTGFLGQSYFNDAPIFRTTDGGLTWEEITLPLAGEWELSSMCASGSDVLMLLTGCGSNSLSNAVLYSGDRGETWERLALPADASGWQADAVRLLGELPENGIALYGLNPKATGLDGLLVAWDGVLACFPSLSYDTGPQAVPAQLALGDYDGDGADELAAMLCTGTGTGVNVWSLYVFEQDGRALTLGGMLDADDVAAAELGLPAGRYVGSQVYFGTEGDGLRIFLGVTDDRGLNDIGELTGAVRYDGQTLSLNPAELTYQEIA